jgi:hypothetical protein
MTLPLVDPLLDNKILIRIIVTIHYKLCDFVDYIYLALNLEQRIPLICARSASYIGIHITIIIITNVMSTKNSRILRMSAVSRLAERS